MTSHLVNSFHVPDPKRPVRAEGFGPSGQLVEFNPTPLDSLGIVGRPIRRWSPRVGTYGMGGPGFVGFDLAERWLVIAIWGAANWLRFDGRLLEDDRHRDEGRDEPWISDDGRNYQALGLFEGEEFLSFDVTRDSINATLTGSHTLTLSTDPDDRPKFADGRARLLAPTDDLRRAVFVAPTDELWI